MDCCFPSNKKFVKCTYPNQKRVKDSDSKTSKYSRDDVSKLSSSMAELHLKHQVSAESGESSEDIMAIPEEENYTLIDSKDSVSEDGMKSRGKGEKRCNDSDEIGIPDIEILPKCPRNSSYLDLNGFSWVDDKMKTDDLSEYLDSLSGSPTGSPESYDSTHEWLSNVKIEEIRKYSKERIIELLDENIIVWDYIKNYTGISLAFLEFLRQIKITRQLELLGEKRNEFGHNVVQAAFAANNIKLMFYFICCMGIDIGDEITLNNEKRNFLVCIAGIRLRNGYVPMPKVLVEMQKSYDKKKFETMVFDAVDPVLKINVTKRLLDLFANSNNEFRSSILDSIIIIFKTCPNIVHRVLFRVFGSQEPIETKLYFILMGRPGLYILTYIIQYLQFEPVEIENLKQMLQNKYMNQFELHGEYDKVFNLALSTS